MTDTNQPTETNEVAFHEKVETPIGRTRAARVGIVAGAAFLFVVGVVAAMGASPAPSTSTGANPAASAAPESSAAPGRIQVSEAVATGLADAFELEPRGAIELKGKGSTEVYFLLGRRS